MKIQVSSIFTFFCKVSVCILLGFLWAPLIVPILCYLTFADIDMKAHMLWDWEEMYGWVNGAKESQRNGIPLTGHHKALLIAGKVSEFGFFIWIPIGILWGFSTRLPSALQWCRLRISRAQPINRNVS